MIITIRTIDNKIIYFNQGNVDNDPEYSEINVAIDFVPQGNLKCAWYNPETLSVYFKECLDEIKQSKLLEIHNACEYEMSTNNYGLYSQTIQKFIDCREIDVTRIGAVLRAMETQGAPENTPLDYICYDNTIAQITLAQMKLIHVELTNEISLMLFHKHNIYATINSYTIENEESINAVKNIQWTWPIPE